MGMFHLWKCPRCYENPCQCEVDAYGDERVTGQYAQSVRLKQRQVELAEERNRLLKEILKKHDTDRG